MKPVRPLAAAFLVLAAGCTRWELAPAVPPAEAPAVARVTPSTTGIMVVLHDVQVTADSVVGYRVARPDGLAPAPARARVALHRSEVLVFERAVTDPWRTTGASLLGLVGPWALLGLYAASQSG
jgi:hypothetical protein